MTGTCCRCRACGVPASSLPDWPPASRRSKSIRGRCAVISHPARLRRPPRRRRKGRSLSRPGRPQDATPGRKRKIPPLHDMHRIPTGNVLGRGLLHEFGSAVLTDKVLFGNEEASPQGEYPRPRRDCKAFGSVILGRCCGERFSGVPLASAGWVYFRTPDGCSGWPSGSKVAWRNSECSANQTRRENLGASMSSVSIPVAPGNWTRDRA